MEGAVFPTLEKALFHITLFAHAGTIGPTRIWFGAERLPSSSIITKLFALTPVNRVFDRLGARKIGRSFRCTCYLLALHVPFVVTAPKMLSVKLPAMLLRLELALPLKL